MSSEPALPPKPRSRQTGKAVAIVVGVLAVIALVIWFWPRQGQAPTGRRFARSGNAVVPVLAAEAATENVPVYINAIGTAKAFNTVTVTPQVSGMITNINFKEGQDVEKGTLLAEIDRRSYEAAYNQTLAKKAQDEALLANARLDLERYTRLSENNAATKQQTDTQKALVRQYEAQVQSDQAAIDSAKTTLDYTWVTAPIAGRTGIRQVDEGNVVQGSTAAAIVVITQMKPISVQFPVPQQQIGALNADIGKTGAPLRADALAGDGKTLLDSGILTVIDNQIDTTTGTLTLKAQFPNAGLKLWPGQFVNIRLLVTTLQNVVTVPTAAIQRGPNGPFVYVVQAETRTAPDTEAAITHKVELRPVTLRLQNDTIAVIDKGVATGETVVTSGFSSIAAGSRVSLSGTQSRENHNPEKQIIDKPGQNGEPPPGRPHKEGANQGKDGAPRSRDARNGGGRRPANGSEP